MDSKSKLIWKHSQIHPDTVYNLGIPWHNKLAIKLTIIRRLLRMSLGVGRSDENLD
jgi:hypothetical protein